MSAKKGSAPAIRSRGRVVGLLMAAVLVLAALAAPTAANAAPPPTSGPIYMALGDSISFGYTQQKFNEHYPTESPSFFEEGVVNFFNKKLGKSVKGVTAVNLACPGETSNGLIGENPALGGEESTEETSPPAPYQGLGDWHPCAYKNVLGFPLHAGYGSISQLEDAVSILTETNPYTGKPNEVKAITLNIGSNDELAAIAQCKDEVTKEFEKEGKSKWGGTPEGAVLACINYTAPNVTIPHILNNLGNTLGVLDTYYSGPIMLLGFYNPQAFVLPGSDALQKAVNEAVEENILPAFPNVTFANPFPVFNKHTKSGAKGAEQEQAAICKFTEMCNPLVQVPGGKPEGKDGDVHPTLVGYKKLAKLVKEAYASNPAK